MPFQEGARAALPPTRRAHGVALDASRAVRQHVNPVELAREEAVEEWLDDVVGAVLEAVPLEVDLACAERAQRRLSETPGRAEKPEHREHELLAVAGRAVGVLEACVVRASRREAETTSRTCRGSPSALLRRRSTAARELAVEDVQRL